MNAMTWSRFTVVLIDDHDITREVLGVLLQKAGYQVIGEAGDARSGLALALAHDKQPDIVFLDRVLPDGDGFDALRQLKSARPDSIVLMVSGDDSPESIVQAKSLGASGVISKPFRVTTILTAVHGALVRAGKLPDGSANAARFDERVGEKE